MLDSGYDWYILFPNHHMGLRLKQTLDEYGVKAVISPTPREAGQLCGISLIVGEGDLPQIERIIAENSIQIVRIVSVARKVWKYRGT